MFERLCELSVTRHAAGTEVIRALFADIATADRTLFGHHERSIGCLDDRRDLWDHITGSLDLDRDSFHHTEILCSRFVMEGRSIDRHARHIDWIEQRNRRQLPCPSDCPAK